MGTNNIMKKLLFVLIIFSMICSLSVPAFAAFSEEWSATAATNDWNTATNWTATGGPYTQQVPLAGDSVVFDTTGSNNYTITLGGAKTAEIGNLVLQSPAAAYTIGIAGSGDIVWLANGGYIQINSGVNKIGRAHV